MDDHRRELQKGATDTLILAALTAGPQYGYALARAITERSGGYFRMTHGTLYPALARLEAAGWVAGVWQEGAALGPKGRPPRRYYTLTEAGHRALAARLDAWATFAAAMDAVLFRPAPSTEAS
jgi:PadR family transcriptional regulator PadR